MTISRSKFNTLLLVIVLLISSSFRTTFASESQRKVAVLPFSFHNATDDVGDVDVGLEIAKVLSKKIGELHGWVCVDQDDIAAVLKREDTADLNGAELGKLLGADAVIVGTVQAFEFEMSSGVGAAAASSALSSATYFTPNSSYVPYAQTAANLLDVASMVPRGHANVTIDAKVISVDSGDVLSTLSGSATSRSATNFWRTGGPNQDFLSQSFANCVAGQATFQAVDQICKQLQGSAAKVHADISVAVAEKFSKRPQDDPPKSHSIAVDSGQGLVTDVNGDLICVNVGKDNGFKIGDRFVVERKAATSSNESVVYVGLITLTDIGNEASLARRIIGGSPLSGDSIRSDQASERKLNL